MHRVRLHLAASGDLWLPRRQNFIDSPGWLQRAPLFPLPQVTLPPFSNYPGFILEISMHKNPMRLSCDINRSERRETEKLEALETKA
jgi:hypothetical protein